MKIGLYTLTFPLHDEAAVNAASMEILSFLNQKGRVGEIMHTGLLRRGCDCLQTLGRPSPCILL